MVARLLQLTRSLVAFDRCMLPCRGRFALTGLVGYIPTMSLLLFQRIISELRGRRVLSSDSSRALDSGMGGEIVQMLTHCP